MVFCLFLPRVLVDPTGYESYLFCCLRDSTKNQVCLNDGSNQAVNKMLIQSEISDFESSQSRSTYTVGNSLFTSAPFQNILFGYLLNKVK